MPPKLGRRGFVQSLSALPVVAAWKEAFASTSSSPKPSKQISPLTPDKTLAVQTLRLLTTAQVWNSKLTGKFARFEDWNTCEGWQSVSKHAGASKRFREVFPHILGDGSLDLPGSLLRVWTNSDNSKFCAFLSVQGADEFAYANNDLGPIYEGLPLPTLPDEFPDDPRTLIKNARAAGESEVAGNQTKGLWGRFTAASFLLAAPRPQLVSTGCVCCATVPGACNEDYCTCNSMPASSCPIYIGCAICHYCVAVRPNGCIYCQNCDDEGGACVQEGGGECDCRP